MDSLLRYKDDIIYLVREEDLLDSEMKQLFLRISYGE